MGRLIDADALLAKFNKKSDLWTALTDEDTSKEFAFYCKLADVIDEMPTVGGWISVKDRLPEEEEDVLVARFWLDKKNKKKCYVEIAERIGEDWLSDSDEYKIGRHYDPYAWMPLPEPPKEKWDD